MPPKPIRDNGFIVQFLARTPQEGYNVILDELVEFYSPLYSDRGLQLKPARKPTHSPRARHIGWYNRVYHGNDLFARVNVQHLETGFDDNPPPGKPTQRYAIYFNVIGIDGIVSNELSNQERDSFLGYWQRKRS